MIMTTFKEKIEAKVNRKIKDIMITDVKTISKEDNTFNAMVSMSENNITCLLIVEDGQLKGIITMKDLLDKVMVKKLDPASVKVVDIMTTNVRTVEAEADYAVAAGTMKALKIKQLPIVEHGKFVGIITQTDLVRVM